MKQIVSIIAFLILCTSCEYLDHKKVSNKNDYQAYLGSGHIKTTSKYFELWNAKIKEDSLQLTSFGVVAGQYNSYFTKTGDIQYLKRAEKALQKAVEIAAIGKAGYLRALARNYISQHRFKEALPLAEEALYLGSGKKESNHLLFDIHMELGNYILAENYLDKSKDMSDFEYLIRLAKWNDHKGDLKTTIRLMEKAMQKAEGSNNAQMKSWSYTNLADYYGHDGRIQEAYALYLKALNLDPQNAYAKKGIAWIIYSYEKNPGEALRILDAITEYHKAPDIYLLKAEIAEYMGDTALYLDNMNIYFEALKNPMYGDMYNVYSIELYLNSTLQFQNAIQLAQREVDNRPTPASYDLLAYSHYKAGNLDKAYEIVVQHVLGASEEPVLLLHAAEILKEKGALARVKDLKRSLKDASFELGPITYKQVMEL